MKLYSTILLSTLFSLSANLSLSASTLEFPQYGFQIDALESPSPVSASMQALVMFLPPSEGFSPNINVQIHTFKGSLEEYREVSQKQFRELQWKLISDTLEDNRWTVEYSGNDLHCYAVATRHNDLIYLATGCSRESQWSHVRDEIRKRVDSFKVTAH